MFKPSYFFVFLIGLLPSFAAFANDAPPSDESIAEMVRLTHAEDNFASLKPQMEAMIRKLLNEAESGKQLSQAQRAAYERGRERMVSVMSAQYNWEAVRQIYLRVYQSTFTQDELNGIIAFYRTPAGSAWVNKMPLLQQQLLQETQEWMQPMIKELKAIADDMRAEIAQSPADPK